MLLLKNSFLTPENSEENWKARIDPSNIFHNFHFYSYLGQGQTIDCHRKIYLEHFLQGFCMWIGSQRKDT